MSASFCTSSMASLIFCGLAFILQHNSDLSARFIFTTDTEIFCCLNVCIIFNSTFPKLVSPYLYKPRHFSSFKISVDWTYIHMLIHVFNLVVETISSSIHHGCKLFHIVNIILQYYPLMVNTISTTKPIVFCLFVLD